MRSYYKRKGLVVNIHIPEHLTFDLIAPMEPAWCQREGREKPRAFKRSYRLKNSENISALATYLRPHNGLWSDRESYLREMNEIHLLEIKEKVGLLIVFEMGLNKADKDPISVNILTDSLSIC